MSNCPICQGSGRINLPVYRSVPMVISQVEIDAKLQDSFRTYDCPECVGKAAAEEQVEILYSRVEIEKDAPAEYARGVIVRKLSDYLVKNGLVEFSEKDVTVNFRDMKSVYARVAVVSRARTQSVEQRRFNQGLKIADEIISIATAKISNWGSYYDRQTVSKAEVHRFVNEAIKEFRERGQSWEPSE